RLTDQDDRHPRRRAPACAAAGRRHPRAPGRSRPQPHRHRRPDRREPFQGASMSQRPLRLRRSQLSVPGSSEKMLRKGAESAADHVFCDLEDAVAPAVKVEARDKIAWALNNLDWGRKTRCVRINDVTTQWCHDDIITIVEKAGANLDTIMLTKPFCAADVIFLDRMLMQLEKKLKLDRRIGIEVLIEEVQA